MIPDSPGRGRRDRRRRRDPRGGRQVAGRDSSRGRDGQDQGQGRHRGRPSRRARAGRRAARDRGRARQGQPSRCGQGGSSGSTAARSPTSSSSASTRVRTASFATEIERLYREGAEGLILDLSGNGGGRLDEAILSSSLFVEDGDIVTTRGRTTGEEIYDAEGDALDPEPTVVMIDGGTASASEILDGRALRLRPGDARRRDDVRQGHGPGVGAACPTARRST